MRPATTHRAGGATGYIEARPIAIFRIGRPGQRNATRDIIFGNDTFSFILFLWIVLGRNVFLSGDNIGVAAARMNPTMNTISPRDAALFVARFGLSLLFLTMGWGKATDFTGTIAYMAQTGAPLPALAALIATVVELGGGIALTLGVAVTPVASALALYTVVTGMIGHHFWTYAPGLMRYDMTIHFYKNISIAGGMLALAAAGAGRYALTRRHQAGIAA
ncbi:DoxX family protein [Tanticharoenia sakaeratensis]|uniref:DoxX family protein n=1 Tax=Tanticharoenia sakaeratensis NBRC 103193 TaxID=1231623 RepID=A0A0D6MP23_9PROT|nr:DoxX family protein [Tanticharoenia sakaeratensis]GAN55160.1 DoxX family protein [Tanticharoenia sakaeratensis NBRC 103193]GBQ24944.1 DoxX family protein [Tanticharoenia sakaeratensis NBRC 103193]